MRLRNYEEAVEAAESGEDLWAALSEFFRDSEVTRISCLHCPPVGAPDARSPRFHAEGFPEELVGQYLEERLYRDNPVLAAARARLEPVYWEEALAAMTLTEREKAFVDRFRAADLGHGVGIPVYGPNGREGHCGLGFAKGVRRIRPQALSSYQWVCQLGHLRYCAAVLPGLPDPKLSDREVEVLNWVAAGKSSGLIAQILGISTHTVDAHMRRICLKLGVSDRISAAVRGVGTGLIHAAE